MTCIGNCSGDLKGIFEQQRPKSNKEGCVPCGCSGRASASNHTGSEAGVYKLVRLELSE